MISLAAVLPAEDKITLPTQYQLIPALDPELTIIKNNSSWYYEQLIGSDNLLICLGDSWTWGDSLGGTSIYQGTDNAKHRLSNIFGYHLSNGLSSDFLNMARPGGSNLEMFNNLNLVLPAVVNRYKQIYLVITLTENCREFWPDDRVVRQSGDQNSWPIRVDFSKDPESLNILLEEYEARMLVRFKNAVKKFINVKTIIGRNFTFNYKNNTSILNGMQPEKNWVEILSDYQQLPGYPPDLKILSQIAYGPLEKHLKDIKLFKQFKMEIFEIFSEMSDAIDWLDKSKLNNKIATRHPTELGHQLWANYLLTYFK
jgi:hypothetical protein